MLWFRVWAFLPGLSPASLVLPKHYGAQKDQPPDDELGIGSPAGKLHAIPEYRQDEHAGDDGRDVALAAHETHPAHNEGGQANELRPRPEGGIGRIRLGDHDHGADSGQ